VEYCTVYEVRRESSLPNFSDEQIYTRIVFASRLIEKLTGRYFYEREDGDYILEDNTTPPLIKEACIMLSVEFCHKYDTGLVDSKIIEERSDGHQVKFSEKLVLASITGYPIIDLIISLYGRKKLFYSV
jgi:hypothetical protein